MMRRAVPSIVVVGLAILLNLVSPWSAGAVALFTDDPLIASTSIKVVHITELRALINALRAQFALGPFVFTDSNLTAGMMVKAQHVIELRTALQDAYVAASRPLPTY